MSEGRRFRLSPRLQEARERQAPALSRAALGRSVESCKVNGFRSNHVGLLELGYREATWAEVEAIAAVLAIDAEWLAGLPPSALPTPVTTRIEEPEPAPALCAPTTPTGNFPPPLPDQAIGSYAYRHALVTALSTADAKLMDRSLKPAEWRAWRDYKAQVRELFAACP